MARGYLRATLWVLMMAAAAFVLTGCPAGYERSYAGISFVWCPAGTFYMGSIEGRDDELPVHRVKISKGFWLSRYEITQDLWQGIMGKNPSRFTGDPRLPVENVSWKEVVSFIGELNRRYPDKIFRLPTEAEWEYACRAGSEREYGFGDNAAQLPDFAWFKENAEGKTHVVGRKNPNAWGLYDMHGNVAEWVSDRYGEYPYEGGTVTDPMGPETGSNRVYRGGSWYHDAPQCRAAARQRDGMDKRDSVIGFRLVME
ncbi:MAG TPA: formylglycine-generating enzyme family protein [Candidatus Hydrogenedentes bacterium]|nr:formylglycine-generating enzyme family protein [Candidatus Hydrogenedentota bacterium]HOV74487.1 formylglycine-generating enzyme family protein [Candidatus Hydrogenedentota bacterium]HPC17282.1 formylglycine-generating enzyme family protein [Candidatus Hydrogenedentota bacterium]HRT21197.1 formylglycine-generating enzyme family protein [Candidatus Hydrogenedentota bacterium]HRT65978.1 formylglycine-generating enzyme family protein [Candidatus Hydrogenedentota bacterium]